jgi:hypothetical protein
MGLIVIAALSLALVIQHERAVRREVEYEGRLSGDLAELRDLRGREIKRLEGDYIRLREELEGKDPGPRSDPRAKDVEAKIARVRSNFDENVARLKASEKRLRAMGFSRISVEPVATGQE